MPDARVTARGTAGGLEIELQLLYIEMVREQARGFDVLTTVERNDPKP